MKNRNAILCAGLVVVMAALPVLAQEEAEEEEPAWTGGLTYTDEDAIEPEPDRRYAGGLLGLNYEWKISETASLTQLLYYYPDFEDSANWRVLSNTALTATIISKFAVRLGYDIRYNNQPIGEADSTDTTSRVSLVYKF